MIVTENSQLEDNMYDYQGLIRDVVQPEIMETVWVKPWDQLRERFTVDDKEYGSGSIVKDIRTSITSNARNYTRADVDPVAGTFGHATAKWTKIYQETAAEVHNHDIAEAANGGITAIAALFQDAVMVETEQLWQLIYDDIYAQMKLDLTLAGTYSDAALNRTTYPTLQPYNELTDTQITVALMRTMMFQTTLNKKVVQPQSYQLLIESAVNYALKPQVALLHSWVLNDKPANQPFDGGYQALGNFEGAEVFSPQGMTTGDVFYARKQDMFVKHHYPLKFDTVPSGRDSVKVVMRVGVNGYVYNPGFGGMMTLKD
jgi:hypothetical protein